MTTDPTDDAFEADIRAMLHRRATDVADRATTVPPIGSAPVGTGSGPPRRPLIAAVAAGVVLLLGIGVAVVRSGDGDKGGQRVVATAPDDLDAASSTEGEPARVTSTSTEPRAATTSSTTTAPGGDGGGASTTVGEDGSTPATGPTPGGDEQSGAEPVVTLEALPGGRHSQRDCDGAVRVADGGPLLRVRRAAPTDAPLTVGVELSGSLVGTERVLSLTIPAGGTSAFQQVDLPDAGAGDVRLAIRASTDYRVGSASTWSTHLDAPEMVVDCLRPMPADPSGGAAAQTIRVGERPADITFEHHLPDLVRIHPVGELPPGLGQVPSGGPVLRWDGVATTPGTFALDVRACHGVELCDGTARVTITVLP